MSSKHVEPFAIKVISSKTGHGVPLVELKTTNGAAYYTDSNGVIAFDEASLMNRRVFFSITSDGYLYPKDFLGCRGQAIDIVPGGSITLEIDQINIAERLYRITGQGIYRHSDKLGLDMPLENPNINAGVMGSDSTQCIIYNNKLYWFWGDTHGPFHIFGNFRTTGATSELPENGGLHPSVGINLHYFTREDGFVKKMVPPLPDGANVVWIGPLFVIKDEAGRERLLTGYASLHGLGEVVSNGVLIFNDDREEWELLKEFKLPDYDWRCPCGGGTLIKENGREYWLFNHYLPVSRVPADMEAVQDPSGYEAFTPLKLGTSYNDADTQLDRDENGNLIWGWKLNTTPLNQIQEEKLISLGLIDPKKDKPHYQFYDVDTGDRVMMHSNSIKWNEYRKRWVLIGTQIHGRSTLGEIWCGEADSITGPWGPLKRILTHKVMSFYNPIQHEYFQEDNGRVIYFEGTYTEGFTNAPPTPHYNYNQIMYRLELDDPVLGLPLEKK